MQEDSCRNGPLPLAGGTASVPAQSHLPTFPRCPEARSDGDTGLLRTYVCKLTPSFDRIICILTPDWLGHHRGTVNLHLPLVLVQVSV